MDDLDRFIRDSLNVDAYDGTGTPVGHVKDPVPQKKKKPLMATKSVMHTLDNGGEAEIRDVELPVTREEFHEIAKSHPEVMADEFLVVMRSLGLAGAALSFLIDLFREEPGKFYKLFGPKHADFLRKINKELKESIDQMKLSQFTVNENTGRDGDVQTSILSIEMRATPYFEELIGRKVGKHHVLRSDNLKGDKPAPQTPEDDNGA